MLLLPNNISILTQNIAIFRVCQYRPGIIFLGSHEISLCLVIFQAEATVVATATVGITRPITSSTAAITTKPTILKKTNGIDSNPRGEVHLPLARKSLITESIQFPYRLMTGQVLHRERIETSFHYFLLLLLLLSLSLVVAWIKGENGIERGPAREPSGRLPGKREVINMECSIEHIIQVPCRLSSLDLLRLLGLTGGVDQRFGYALKACIVVA